MNLLVVTLVHVYIIVIFLFLRRVVKLKQGMFFSPINILFLFTSLYLAGFYARYIFYYDIYFDFISDDSYEIYSLFLFLFFSVFAISYIGIKPNGLVRTLSNNLSNIRLSDSKTKFYLKSFFIYCIAYILLMVLISKTSISPFQDPLEFRIKSGHNFGIMFVLMLYCFSLPLFYSVYFRVKNNISNVQFYIMMIVTVLIYFFFGSRMLLVSLVINFLMIRNNLLVRTKTSFLKLFLFSIITLFFIVIYGAYRDVASEAEDVFSAFSLIFDNFGSIFLFYFSEPLMRFSQFVHFLWIIEYEKIGVLSMQYGETLLNFFHTYIPRFLYPDKPLFLSMEIQKILSGSTDTPRTASAYFFAEAYLNLYWFSLCVYPVILAFITKTLQLLYKLSRVKKDFVFFFIYKDIMWYLYIIYDGLNSISLQLVVILFVFNLFSLFVFRQRSIYVVK